MLFINYSKGSEGVCLFILNNIGDVFFGALCTFVDDGSFELMRFRVRVIRMNVRI